MSMGKGPKDVWMNYRAKDARGVNSLGVLGGVLGVYSKGRAGMPRVLVVEWDITFCKSRYSFLCLLPQLTTVPKVGVRVVGLIRAKTTFTST